MDIPLNQRDRKVTHPKLSEKYVLTDAAIIKSIAYFSNSRTSSNHQGKPSTVERKFPILAFP